MTPDLVEEIAEAAGRHEDQDEPYLARIRRRLASIGASEVQPGDARAALFAVEEHARIDLDVPTRSSHRQVAVVKAAIKRLTGWYLRYVGDQITLFGQAVVRFGTSIVGRTEQLEETTHKLSDDMAALVARVERLERSSDGS